MDAQFSFRVDRARGLIRITMSGLFTIDAIDDFLRARAKAPAELGLLPNQHLTINDLRGMKIQTQEVVAAFRDMLAAPEYRSRRLAFVAGPTLARSQLMRALSGRDARCFEDPAVAEAWLLAEDSDGFAARQLAV
jgi:hypothetical protein